MYHRGLWGLCPSARNPARRKNDARSDAAIFMCGLPFSSLNTPRHGSHRYAAVLDLLADAPTRNVGGVYRRLGDEVAHPVELIENGHVCIEGTYQHANPRRR